MAVLGGGFHLLSFSSPNGQWSCFAVYSLSSIFLAFVLISFFVIIDVLQPFYCLLIGLKQHQGWLEYYKVPEGVFWRPGLSLYPYGIPGAFGAGGLFARVSASGRQSFPTSFSALMLALVPFIRHRTGFR